MKKLVRVSALMIAGLAMFAFTNRLGDNNFEGVISYDVKIDSDNPQAAQMMQGMTLKTYMKGSKARSETNAGMYNQITIVDNKNPDGAIVLINMMGSKYQLKMDETAKKEADKNTPEIKYLDGTKTIAGYACKEAQMIIKDKKSGESYTSDIYYTDQLPYTGDSKFKGLKGFPLSFTMKQRGATMTMTATSISKQSVPDSMFVAPAGYKLMTGEEMQKDMMSKMSGGGGN